MSGIQGSYPGGPRRGSGDDERIGERRAPGAARIERAEEIDARRTAGAEEARRARRSKRFVVGLVTATIVAAGVGIFLGYRAHKTSEAITAERNEAATGKTGVFDPTFQTNRVLDELWKMEIKQRQPGPP